MDHCGSNGFCLAHSNPESYAKQYQSAEPFPHIVIDNFLPNEAAIALREHFPEPTPEWYSYSNVLEIKRATDKADLMGFMHSGILNTLNSQLMIDFLEKMTGIKGLIPDPWFRGGGLHYIKKGGKLDIHADFNWHQHLQLHRRLNVLIYLNDEVWESEWGGQLELWDKDMKNCVKKIDPIFNRMVCFSTTDWSFHGHPEPLASPNPRRSMALYYYSATRPEHEITPSHSTLFRARPNDEETEEIKKLRELRNKGRLSSNWDESVR